MADASNERAAAAATGTLAARPLLHLLVYARNRRLSGTLELHAPDGRSGAITLWRGRVTSARTMPPVAYFGTVAYELGLIDTPTLDATLLEIARTKRLHGEVLVERGALTAAVRDEVLAEQTCRKIHHLFAMPGDASFAFYDDARPAAHEPPFTLDTIAPAWRGLRDHPLKDNVDDILRRLDGAVLHVVNEAPIARAGFSDEERELCTALAERPMTLVQLRVGSRLPSARVDLIVYLLVVTKCAEPVASSEALPVPPRGPASSGSLPAVRPPASSGSLPAAARSSGSLPAHHSLSFRVPSVPGMKGAGAAPTVAVEAVRTFGPDDVGATGIAHRAQSIEAEDFFQALGLDEGASVEAARAAYHRLARLWHPDRLPADLAPFSVEVAMIFDHLTRAHATLTDADARAKYLTTREKDPRAAAAARAFVERPAKDVMRDIEQALARRDFPGAESMSQQLLAHAPENADAQALIAWSRAAGGEAPEDVLRAVVPLLDAAVNLDAYCERALFYRGVLHKRLGSGTAAFRDFARVVQLDPKHVDAQREIRIMEMRARKGGSGEHALDALVIKAAKKK